MSNQTQNVGVNINNNNINSNVVANNGQEFLNQNSVDIMSQSKDAQTMISVLKDMGVDDFEPRVVNQLLEFSYRNCSIVLNYFLILFFSICCLLRLCYELVRRCQSLLQPRVKETNRLGRYQNGNKIKS
jgi:hypothetical protein